MVAVAVKRPCSYPGGCAALVESGRCEKHAGHVERERGSSTSRGYGVRWRNERNQHLRDHPLCVDPYGVHGKWGETARHVDHREPKRGDDPAFFDHSNWQSLCVSCHSRKTASKDGGFGNWKR